MTAASTQPVKLAIAGAAGRMGQRLCALALETPGVTLAEAFDHPEYDVRDERAAGSNVPITTFYSGGADVLIDFTAPPGTRDLIGRCVETGTALVIGTTGLDDDDQRLIDAAAGSIGIIQATNFSLVVNVLNLLAARAAHILGNSYDIEIAEAHHRHKKDAPSGTALTLAREICAATGRSFEDDVVTSRSGADCPRDDRQITVQALRLGDVVGEHTVMFAAPGERMELKHI
ncbi:MAG: 4-hydroxy-tetrahydrodipicolinate reductase, partial [Phycisphaerae bacterium]|nr:4-hydroxy-tetrahydrodipicolinate reductase [Phycisphaerae bacterium]